jgi:hypothetical protein
MPPARRAEAERAADVTWVGAVATPAGSTTAGVRLGDRSGERRLTGFEHVA